MPDKEVNIIGEIEGLLSQIEKAHPDQKTTVAAIRHRLRSLGAKPRPPVRRRTGQETSYTVEGTGGQASLAEHRPSGPPLRVPKRAYDVVVDVLSTAARPLPFDELMSAMRDQTDPPADWQVRVVLRYLLRADPPVLRRSRSRYQPVTSGKFRTAASKWWKAAGG